jgi:hypothetical protein
MREPVLCIQKRDMTTPATQIEIEELWGEQRLSRVIHKSLDAIRRDRVRGVGIPYIKIGKLVRYDPADVRKYLEECKRRTASGTGAQK